MNRDYLLFKIGRISWKVDRFLAAELAANGIAGIAPSHGEIIGSLLMRGPLMMNELAAIIGKDKSTVTALIQKLINEGFVEKIKDQEDRRISRIALTGKGESLQPVYQRISKRLRERAYKGFTEEEKETLTAFLIKLNNNL